MKTEKYIDRFDEVASDCVARGMRASDACREGLAAAREQAAKDGVECPIDAEWAADITMLYELANLDFEDDDFGDCL